MINKIKKYIDKNRKQLIIILIFVFLLIMIAIVKKFDSTEKETLDSIGIKNSNMDINEDVEERIVIHVTGEVKKEGIIKIDEGGRISDAIEKAGGLTEEADLDRINLAYQLEDGQKIYIPNKKDKSIDNYITDGTDEIVLQGDETESNTSYININKATSEELQTLNGIGESLAKSIIQYREENGKFKNKEDLKNVAGIGENKYIEDYIKVI